MDQIYTTQLAATVASSAALSEAVEISGQVMGGIITPAALEATTVIGFKVSEARNGTFVPLRNVDNGLVQVTVTLDAAAGYPLLDELRAWPAFKVWTCTTAGVDVTQTAARAFKFVAKG